MNTEKTVQTLRITAFCFNQFVCTIAPIPHTRYFQLFSDLAPLVFPVALISCRRVAEAQTLFQTAYLNALVKWGVRLIGQVSSDGILRIKHQQLQQQLLKSAGSLDSENLSPCSLAALGRIAFVVATADPSGCSIELCAALLPHFVSLSHDERCMGRQDHISEGLSCTLCALWQAGQTTACSASLRALFDLNRPESSTTQVSSFIGTLGIIVSFLSGFL